MRAPPAAKLNHPTGGPTNVRRESGQRLGLYRCIILVGEGQKDPVLRLYTMLPD